VIDEYRLPLMQMKLKAGRNISSSFPSDEKHGALVNEAFVKAAGLKTPDRYTDPDKRSFRQGNKNDRWRYRRLSFRIAAQARSGQW
jgi:hypothetical protein